MKTLIVDDERLARQELKNLLSSIDDIEIIGEAANADEAEEMIEDKRPELVFLDIQMPGKDGFQLLEDLTFVPRVVFVTAYDEYAIKAFEVNALDYLVKPVNPDRLNEAIQKVRDNIQLDQQKEDFMVQSSLLSGGDQVFLKDG